MEMIITKVGPLKTSVHGGVYNRVILKCFEDDKSYRLDVYHNHTMSKRFLPYMKPQAIFSGLSLFKGNIVNGNSNFTFKGIKNAVQ
jgi:hypothetical protein